MLGNNEYCIPDTLTLQIVDASPLTPTGTERMNVSADAVRSADAAKSDESTMPLLDWILTVSTGELIIICG